jgi:hypothetical protein
VIVAEPAETGKQALVRHGCLGGRSRVIIVHTGVPRSGNDLCD